jgi:hypothetical protein
MRCFFAKLAIFLAGAAVLALAVSRADSLADVDVVGPKLDALASSQDVDTLFVGSSYFYREISPRLFDETMRDLGVETHSFNLGVPGMDPPESYMLLEEALERGGGRIRIVLLELDYYRALVRDQDEHTRRFDAWHDATRTLEALDGLRSADASMGKRLKDAAAHLEAWARRGASLGRGPSIVERRRADSSALGAAGDGFRALDDEKGDAYDLRRGLFDEVELARWSERVDALRRGAPTDAEDRTSPIDEIALARMAARVEAAGARLILVVPPALQRRSGLVDVASRLGLDVVALNDPDAYAELYDPSLRFDFGHLNRAGALALTRALAREAAPARAR